MSRFKIGDVLAIAYFPNQENKNEGTARYILIIDVFDDGYCILPLSCQTHQASNYKKTIFIGKASPLGVKMGLTCDSILIIDRQIEIKKIVLKPPIMGNCGEEFLEDNNL